MYPIKQNTAVTIPVFCHNASGDAVTGLSSGDFTKRISKGSGAFAAMTVTITELENGWYTLPLTTTQTNTLGLLSITLTHASTKQVNLQFRVSTRLPDDVCFPTTSGRSLDVSSTGNAAIDLTNASGALEKDDTLLGFGVLDDVDEMLEEHEAVHRFTAAALAEASAATNPAILLTAEIATVTDQTHFTLATGSDQDDDYNDQAIVLYDDSNSDYPNVRKITDYVGASLTVTIDTAPDFTLGTDDSVRIFMTPVGMTAPTVGEIQAEMEEDGASLLDTIRDDLANGTDGLGALKTLIDAVPTVAEIQAEMEENGASILDTLQDRLTAARAGYMDELAAANLPQDIDAIKAQTDDQPAGVPKNVALSNFMFLMTDSTNHDPSTGLTVAGSVSKDGGAFTGLTNSVSEVASGMYKVDITSTEMNADVVTVRFTATASDDRFITILTSA